MRWREAHGFALALAPILAMTLLSPARAARPRRIVSLVPSVTETLFALGAGTEVVGVSQYCTYPPAALRLPRVGSFSTPNIERIVGLRPTLIVGLALASNQRALAALRDMGYPLLMVDEGTLGQIEGSITKIGDRIGRGAQAHALVAQIKASIATTTTRLRGVRPRSVLMLVGHQPLVAVGRGTYLDQLIGLAGGRNIADVSGQQWPRLSMEYVIAMKPEVILDGQMGSDAKTPDGFWSRYPAIPAVRDHHLYSYPQAILLHPGPRVAQSLEILARLIHPKRFPAQSSARQAAR